MGSLELDRGALDQAEKDFDRAAVIDRQISYTRGWQPRESAREMSWLRAMLLAGAISAYTDAEKVVAGLDEPELASL